MERLREDALQKQLEEIRRDTSFDAPLIYGKKIKRETHAYHAVSDLKLSLSISQESRANHRQMSPHTSEAEALIRMEFDRRKMQDWVRPGIGMRREGPDLCAPIVQNCAEQCRTCSGTSSVTCSTCNGHQKVACPNYSCSRGQVSCSHCKNGQRQCPGCYGSGSSATSSSGRCEACRGSGIYGTCNSCGGRAKVDCNTCRGHAKVTCTTCRGTGACTCFDCVQGTRFLRLTGKPRISETVVRTAPNQRRFDLLTKTIPAMLTDKSAFYPTQLTVKQDGDRAHVEYDAKIHAAVTERDGQIGVGVGAEGVAPYISDLVRLDAIEPVSAALKAGDLKGLSRTPLGEAVLDEIRKPDQADKPTGLMAFYDRGQLRHQIQTYRSTMTRQITRGTLPWRIALYALAVLAPLSVYEFHVLQFLTGIGINDMRVPIWATLILPGLCAMAYGFTIGRRASKMKRRLNIGDIALPGVKTKRVIVFGLIAPFLLHGFMMGGPIWEIADDLRNSGIPATLASPCYRHEGRPSNKYDRMFPSCFWQVVTHDLSPDPSERPITNIAELLVSPQLTYHFDEEAFLRELYD